MNWASVSSSLANRCAPRVHGSRGGDQNESSYRGFLRTLVARPEARCVVPARGFEPRLGDSKSPVLPLDDTGRSAERLGGAHHTATRARSHVPRGVSVFVAFALDRAALRGLPRAASRRARAEGTTSACVFRSLDAAPARRRRAARPRKTGPRRRGTRPRRGARASIDRREMEQAASLARAHPALGSGHPLSRLRSRALLDRGSSRPVTRISERDRLGQLPRWIRLQTPRITSHPMKGRSTSGTITVPSSCWYCSRIAINVRPTARAEPFSVCARRGFALGSGR